MEFLKFIFSSPWIWLGFLILVCCVLKYMVDLVRCTPAQSRKVHHIQDKRRQLAGCLLRTLRTMTLRPRLIRQECVNICVSS